jgi:hypothetical protein
VLCSWLITQTATCCASWRTLCGNTTPSRWAWRLQSLLHQRRRRQQQQQAKRLQQSAKQLLLLRQAAVLAALQVLGSC